jgi:DNA polymerase V
LVYELRGTVCIPLENTPPPQKNIASTRSFGRRIHTLPELKEAVATYATRIGEKLRRQGLVASSLYVFINTNRFSKDEQYGNGAEAKLPLPTSHTPSLIHTAHELLERIFVPGYHYWKAGVLGLGLSPDTQIQQNLFIPYNKEKITGAMRALDAINKKHGRNTLRSASMGFDRGWEMKRNMLSDKYTTSWKELPVVKA